MHGAMFNTPGDRQTYRKSSPWVSFIENLMSPDTLQQILSILLGKLPLVLRSSSGSLLCVFLSPQSMRISDPFTVLKSP